MLVGIALTYYKHLTVMKHLLKTYMLLLLAAGFSFLRGYGQGWIRLYTGAPGSTNWLNDLTPTPDGGFAFVGTSELADSIPVIWVVKADANGDIQWEKRYGSTGPIAPGEGYSIITTSDGGYAVTGTELGFGAINRDIFLLKLDALGNQEWYKLYITPEAGSAGKVVRQLPDGGFILAGGTYLSFYGENIRYLIRTDSAGNAIFIKDYYGMGILDAKDMIANADGSVVICGWINTVGDTTGTSILGDTSGMYLMRLDPAGNLDWGVVIDTFTVANAVEKTPDGGYIVAAAKTWSSVGDAFILRFDSTGGVLWQEKMDYAPNLRAPTILANGDDTYMVLMMGILTKGQLAKIDGTGSLIWAQGMYPIYQDGSLRVAHNGSGGYYLGGVGGDPGGVGQRISVLKTDSLGNITSNYISGHIYSDLNGNCTADPGEDMYRDRPVEAAGPHIYYSSADSAGFYFIESDTGTYSVSAVMPYPYWNVSSCASNPDTVSFPVPYDSVVVDFPMQPTVICPGMAVSMTHTPLRCGVTSAYHFEACNYGTTGDDAYVVVELDPYLNVTSSTIPWNLPQFGNTYVFDLGYLDSWDCTTFSLSVLLACDSTVVVGQTHCVEAHIYPDSLCTPPSPFWDGVSVKLTGFCTASEDSVKFWIHNTSTINMATPGNVIVLEDNIMRLNTNFDLDAGDSTLIALPANGSTWSCKAAQRPFHPGSDNPMIAIEGCGVNGSGTFSTGFVNTLPQNDADPWIDIDCSQNVASLDPNVKEATPSGRLAPNYIQNTDQLEYTIHFQNTGTDTAFKVVVRDTLSSFLDILSIVPGAATHPCTFRLYGYNIAEWTFDNILLPDSGTDLAGSQGAFEFTIRQQAGNPVGSEILNGVSIWFDFNAPVPTNIVLRTIGDDLWGMISVDPPQDQLANTVKAYPNPSSSSVWFEMTEPVKGRLHLQVTDLTGRVVYSREESAGSIPELKKGDLAKGVYLFRLSDDSGRTGTGRIVLY